MIIDLDEACPAPTMAMVFTAALSGSPGWLPLAALRAARLVLDAIALGVATELVK